MRNKFREIAKDNTTVAYEHLEDFYQTNWKLAQTSSDIIDRCLSLDASLYYKV